MTGNDFLTTLRAAIAPATITTTRNNIQADGIDMNLSDGRTILAKRKRIKDCADQAELDAYIEELLA